MMVACVRTYQTEQSGQLSWWEAVPYQIGCQTGKLVSAHALASAVVAGSSILMLYVLYLMLYVLLYLLYLMLYLMLYVLYLMLYLMLYVLYLMLYVLYLCCMLAVLQLEERK